MSERNWPGDECPYGFRLKKEEWEELDRLLGKHGFGGYYDLVESLKGVLSRIAPSVDQAQIKDLPTVVRILMGASGEAQK